MDVGEALFVIRLSRPFAATAALVQQLTPSLGPQIYPQSLVGTNDNLEWRNCLR